MLINPFFIYAISFTSVMFFYFLDWSRLIPQLSWSLFFFIIISVSLSIGLFYFSRKSRANFPAKFSSIYYDRFERLSDFIFMILVVVMFLQFLYAGTIPLIAKIRGIDIDYTDFGIPVLYVIYLTASTVFATFFFDFFLVAKRKKYLWYSIALAFSFILIFNRGAFMIYLFQILAVYFIRKGINFKKSVYLIIFLMGILFVFGWAGNLRENHDNTNISSISSDYIMSIGGARDDFVSSNIPKEFFWGYLYAVTPMANFQNNINENPHVTYDVDDFSIFIVNELLPDFISKRVNSNYSIDRLDNERIATSFTVGTIYGKSYNYTGWVGVFLTNFVFFLIMYLFMRLTNDNSTTVTALAVITVFSLFAIFTNVIAFSGLSLQLFWAFFIHKLYK